MGAMYVELSNQVVIFISKDDTNCQSEQKAVIK